MLAVSAQELLQIQQDAYQAACDLTCVIQRGSSRVINPQGGGTTTPNTIATVKAGMSQPSGTQLQNYGFLVEALEAFLLKFPIGTDVQHGDIVIIAGQKLIVQAVLNPRSYPALLTVIASITK